MSSTWTIVAAVLSSGAFTAVVNGIIAALANRRSKKTGAEARLSAMEEKLDKLVAHDNEQYLSILRLTVMDSDMPMSERLIAGKKYIESGGNGDVKHFFAELERRCNAGENSTEARRHSGLLADD